MTDNNRPGEVERADRRGGADIGDGSVFTPVNVTVGEYVYLKQQGTDEDDRATSSIIVLDRPSAEKLARTIRAALTQQEKTDAE